MCSVCGVCVCMVYVLCVWYTYLHTCVWQSKAWKDSHGNIKSYQARFGGWEVF